MIHIQRICDVCGDIAVTYRGAECGMPLDKPCQGHHILPVPGMRQDEDSWLFIDDFYNVYRLRPTHGREHIPLEIIIEEKR